jgi:tetratricopeptide (TPR) repeat protein
MSNPDTPTWRRWLARWWYAWGLSVCYAAARMQDRSLFRSGANAFGRAARNWPDFAQAHYQRGAVRGRELGEYEGAVADLSRASELDPSWPDPYLQRGLLYRFNGRPAEARADLLRYIELAPEGAWREEAARQLAALEREGEGMV